MGKSGYNILIKYDPPELRDVLLSLAVKRSKSERRILTGHTAWHTVGKKVRLSMLAWFMELGVMKKPGFSSTLELRVHPDQVFKLQMKMAKEYLERRAGEEVP